MKERPLIVKTPPRVALFVRLGHIVYTVVHAIALLGIYLNRIPAGGLRGSDVILTLVLWSYLTIVLLPFWIQRYPAWLVVCVGRTRLIKFIEEVRSSYQNLQESRVRHFGLWSPFENPLSFWLLFALVSFFLGLSAGLG